MPFWFWIIIGIIWLLCGWRAYYLHLRWLEHQVERFKGAKEKAEEIKFSSVHEKICLDIINKAIDDFEREYERTRKNLFCKFYDISHGIIALLHWLLLKP